jgi:hypothetical protein
VIHPRGDGWTLNSIKLSNDTFDQRADLPAAWAGLTDTALEDASGVKGAKFCHNGKCSIPDHHIDPRRSAFFMARSVLRDIQNGVQPCLCIDAVELGGLNQGIDDGGGFAATLGPHEHVVFATNGDAAHASFGCVVVQLKKPVIQVTAQPLHAVESVANGVGQGRLSRAFAISSERVHQTLTTRIATCRMKSR